MSSEIGTTPPKTQTLKLKFAPNISLNNAAESSNKAVAANKVRQPTETTVQSFNDHTNQLNVLLDDIYATTSALDDTQNRLEKINNALEKAANLLETPEKTDAPQAFNALLNEIRNTAATSEETTNLLQNDQLNITLDVDGRKNLVINGADFSAQNLGLSELSDGTTSYTEAQNQVKNAQQILYNFRTKINNDNASIKDQESFTQGAINTIQNAEIQSDKTEKSEESANLLALQTRQILSNNANVPLASKSQQSLLKLF